jgi:spoIIIJ-associated protein
VSESPESTDTVETADTVEIPDTMETAGAASDAAVDAEAGATRPTGSARLEEEGEVAADYLEELLDIADLDGDIDIDVENGRAAVSIVADPVASRSLRKLVGPDGEVLEALQELTRLAVQTRTGERSRLMLDIASFRAGRRTELEALAGRAVAEVRRTGERLQLDPMSPFERKVVHDAVAAAGLASESEGEEPRRRVVVLPGQD